MFVKKDKVCKIKNILGKRRKKMFRKKILKCHKIKNLQILGQKLLWKENPKTILKIESTNISGRKKGNIG